jgi:ribonuclease J
MRDSGKVPDNQLAIISTGHQGELNSVLMRMASGEHRFVKLKPTDTVILSASPIPGNEKAVVQVVDRLMREGTKVYQHITRELDSHGALHVSGHGNRDELSEMIPR